jgi:hypothetical protein
MRFPRKPLQITLRRPRVSRDEGDQNEGVRRLSADPGRRWRAKYDWIRTAHLAAYQRGATRRHAAPYYPTALLAYCRHMTTDRLNLILLTVTAAYGFAPVIG